MSQFIQCDTLCVFGLCTEPDVLRLTVSQTSCPHHIAATRDFSN